MLRTVLAWILMGLLCRVVWYHGCGPACRASQHTGNEPPSCSCACASCPCSPLDKLQDAINTLPEAALTCGNTALSWVQAGPAPTDDHIKSVRISNSDEYIIEQSDQCLRGPELSQPNTTTNLGASETKLPTAAGTSKCAPPSDLSSDKSSRKDTPIAKLEGEKDVKPRECNMCKEKGVTCMGSCPKHKKSM